MAVSITTYNEILGLLVRKVLADTNLNDINDGSVLLTLLEAVATNDFENSAAILSVLELLNLDVLKNSDLDARAADYGLTRNPAVKASGFVTITDTTIQVQSTSLYPVMPAPIAGSTVLYVNSTTNWASTGKLYIAQGTPNYEGPISYTNITAYPTYSVIQLASALQNDHLISDVVVNGQGTVDRVINAGTVVRIPANNVNPQINYTILRNAVIPAGQNTVTNVAITAQQPGSQGNAGIGTITSFVTPPFTGAAVTNTNALTNGADTETDDQLRERIKSYVNTLARGTQQAILSAIIGLSDATDGKQVASAVITEPAAIGEPSIVYIDDGTGFQPSFSGQNVDLLVSSASGKEQFLQLSNYPLPRPQVINTSGGPFELTNGSTFGVLIDGVEEQITFSTSDFKNITSATLPEVVSAINNKASTFKARMHNNSTLMLLYPSAWDAEIIQVAPIQANQDATSYANTALGFPTNQYSYIKLYQNNKLLTQKEKSASLTTTPFTSWNVTQNSDIVFSVDGTPAQDQTFTQSDFGGASWPSITLDQWVAAFNTKFAGLKATATSAGQMVISSNQSGTASSVEALSGALLDKWFASLPTSSTGQDSDFNINRMTGNLEMLTTINPGDSISAGIADAKGAIVSSPTLVGTYNVTPDSYDRPAQFIAVSDASSVGVRAVTMPIGSTIAVSSPSSNVMRIMASVASTFEEVQPLDYLYITNRGDNDGSGTGEWLDILNCGLFKVVAKGAHTNPGVDTYIDVNNPTVVAGSYTVQANEDIQAFSADAYPQIWLGDEVATPAAEPIQGIVDSINDQLEDVVASVLNTNTVKLTSSTESGGSIAIPVSVGLSTLLFATGQGNQDGNPPHVASILPTQPVYSYFKRTQPTNTNVFLGRYTYTDVNGSLTLSAKPYVQNVYNPYSEELQSTGVLNTSNINYDSIFLLTKGANKGHHRSIKDIMALDMIGTQFNKPNTIMDYVVGDQFTMLHPLELSSDDSIVFIIDQDPVAKTVSIPLSRTGRVNSTANLTAYSFSADDADNQPGINFSNLQVWGTEANGTNFQDYAVWFRAHNWYASGGVGSGSGAFIVRANEYGPHGENIRFNIDYPTFPNQPNSTTYTNTPAYTEFTYFFGSGPAKPISISTGLQFSVSSLGNHKVRYTFNGSINLTPVVVGDILSIANTAGVSAANSGTFSILAKGTNTIDIYNPNASLTGVGTAEVDQVVTVADIQGTPAQESITCVAESAGNLQQNYFTLYDDIGMVVFWYNVNNVANTTPPTVTGASRYVEIATVASADSASTVANKTATIINSDLKFSATVATNVVTTTNKFNGPVSVGTTNIAGMSVTQVTAGTENISLDGKWFTIYDQNGSVAVWYQVNSTTPMPLHGADRAIQVSTVNRGDSAATVASKTAAVMANDAAFASVTASGNVITITDAVIGGRSSPQAETSGFTVSVVTPGTNAGNEVIGQTASVNIFSLMKTAVSDIQTAVNSSNIVLISPIGSASATVTFATREDVYTPTSGGYSTSLAYGHNPDPTSGYNAWVSLYDSQSWVKTFSNSSPNFILKSPLILVGVSSAYNMQTAPNSDTSSLGEAFKLIPRTIDNLYHHFTQSPLSQLAIVADVAIADDTKKVQVKSQQLGSAGAVEVVGGRANSASFKIYDEAQVDTYSGSDYTEIKIDAYPNTLNIGNAVVLANPTGVQRQSPLQATDTFDVIQNGSGIFEYHFNPKACNFSPYTQFTIADVSSSYGKPSGIVWRWTFDNSGSYYTITDKNIGTVAQVLTAYNATGGQSLSLQVSEVTAGSSTTAHVFSMTVFGMPAQGDFFTFSSQGGHSYAVWFSINGNTTAPTAAAYTSATYQIMIPITSSQTPNQIMATLANTLTVNSTSAITQFITDFNGVISLGANVSAVNEGDMLFAFNTFLNPVNVTVANGTATAVTTNQHLLEVGSVVNVVCGSVVGSVTVASIINRNSFTFSTTAANGTYTGGTVSGWSSGNWARLPGDGYISGFPVVAVNANANYVDVVNPTGQAMPSTAVGIGNVVQICPTPALKWRLKHAARTQIQQVSVANGVATALCITEHGFRVNDSFNIIDNSATPTTGTVINVISPLQFVYLTSVADGVYTNGSVLDSTKTVTRYKVETLSFGNIVRITAVNGQSPQFLDCGVAVDDVVVIGGTTFNANNNGQFRVIGVDNTSLLLQNQYAQEQLNTINDFNNLGLEVNWTNSSAVVTGVAGAFENLNIGDWVKKQEDNDTFYRQVVGFNTGSASTATSITLGTTYAGTTSSSVSVAFTMTTNVEQGVWLRSVDDIQVFEGDATFTGDSLYIDNLVNPTWFKPTNCGTFTITTIGTDTTGRIFLRVNNSAGITQTGVSMNISPNGVFIIESDANKFSTIREVAHVMIDDFNQSRRAVYLTPAGREYKFSATNGTTVTALGKIGYQPGVTIGIDGYSYYTGLMQAVQRTIDGYEPDATNYPGMRAVGGLIETLPPLANNIEISVQVTTNNGVNVTDISSQIQSAIISYVEQLDVGEDVVLAEIIVSIMSINGVQAATFVYPAPSTVSIPIASNEKAYIDVSGISIV